MTNTTGVAILALKIFGYAIGLYLLGHSNIPTLLFHFLIISVAIYLLIEAYYTHEFSKRIPETSLRLASNYLKFDFPSPRKYGYLALHGYKEQAWDGQGYLEAITSDESVSELARSAAKFMANDMIKAERTNYFQEKRLMKLALEAMKKYNAIIEEHPQEIAAT